MSPRTDTESNDDDDVISLHSDDSSFFDVEDVATTTTESARGDREREEFDFMDEDEETGDEL